MNNKTILARLKRRWQSQENDRIIWNQGILPNFITPNGIYNPKPFTCYQLFKILQKSFSYQNLYKYLRKYEGEEILESKVIINEKNRRERIYFFSEWVIRRSLYTLKYIQNAHDKPEAQELFETIQEYSQPKQIYNNYINKKISRDNALNVLQYIINQGEQFEEHKLETLFLLDSLDYFVKMSKKDKNLCFYLEEINVSHNIENLRKKAFEYIRKYFPNYQNIETLETFIYPHSHDPESLDDYIKHHKRHFEFRLWRRDRFKDLKDQKLLDFHGLAKEKLGNFSTYMRMLNDGNYDPIINRLVYMWSISLVYKKVENFEQEPFETIISLENLEKGERYWHYGNKAFYFILRIFHTVLGINDKDIYIGIHKKPKDSENTWHRTNPDKIFSEKTDIIVYYG